MPTGSDNMQSEGWETGCSATVCPPTMTSSTYVSPGGEKSEKIDLSSDLDHKKRLMVLCLSGSRGFENCFQVPFKPHELRWVILVCSKIYLGMAKRRKKYTEQRLWLAANDFFLALKEGEGERGTPGSWLVHLFFPSKTCTSLFRGFWVHTCAVLSGLDPNSEWATIKMFLQVVLHKTGYIFSITVFFS